MGESDDRFFELAVNRLETSTDFRNLVSEYQGVGRDLPLTTPFAARTSLLHALD